MNLKINSLIVAGVLCFSQATAQESALAAPAKKWITENAKTLGIPTYSELDLSFVKKGNAGETLRFQQSITNVPVYQSEILVHYNKDGKVTYTSSENLKREIRTMAVYGGVSINPQMKGMFGVEILVATPGRLLDLIEHNALSISQISHLVVDEADKMFQLGFEEEMNKLFAMMPVMKQTTLFSATLNEKVEDIKKRLTINPVLIEIKQDEIDIDQITQIAYHVTNETKGPFLRFLIKEQEIKQALIFTSSTRIADHLVEKLKKNKIPATAIHGKKSQGARTGNLRDFKEGETQILVATDLIGRGIHIESLPVVINYELPRSPLDYVHRIGRTGRAGYEGVAISFCDTDEKKDLNNIQKLIGFKMPVVTQNIKINN